MTCFSKEWPSFNFASFGFEPTSLFDMGRQQFSFTDVLVYQRLLPLAASPLATKIYSLTGVFCLFLPFYLKINKSFFRFSHSLWQELPFFAIAPNTTCLLPEPQGHVYVCVCARACVRASVCVCGGVCARVCLRARMDACVSQFWTSLMCLRVYVSRRSRGRRVGREYEREIFTYLFYIYCYFKYTIKSQCVKGKF